MAQKIYRKDYAPHPFKITHVKLDITFDAKQTKILSWLKIERNTLPNTPMAEDLVLDGNDLILKQIQLDGKVLPQGSFEVLDEQLVIKNAPDQFELFTEVDVFPETNKAFKGLFCTDKVLCTQCEAEGFRHITFYIDRPDNLAIFTTTVRGNKDEFPVLLANGNKLAEGVIKDLRYVEWHDPHPKPSYLFAIVGGELASVRDHFTTQSGKEVELVLYIEHGMEDRCEHAMQSLINSMKWDEEQYGREYDLDIFMIVAVSDFNFGAMENKGLNIFNSKYVLANPRTATDADYEGVEGVIGHEYFHNWSGNRVTCRDWFQLSLKEGFTVLRDQDFSSDMNSRPVKRISEVKILRNQQFTEDSGPLAHPIRPESYEKIDNFYTATIYEKGAEVVRMLKTLAGDKGFRKGTDLYFKRHDGSAATCEDFVKAIEDANGLDLKQFRNWYHYAGTPDVTVMTEYEEESQTFTLFFTQKYADTPGQTDKVPMHIPIKFGMLTGEGAIMPLYTSEDQAQDNPDYEMILNLKKSAQHFTFYHVDEEPIPSLFRNFSAPIKFKAPQDKLAHQLIRLQYDVDAFNRWEAGQHIAMQMIEDKMNAPDASLSIAYINCYRELLLDNKSDPALSAQLLTLPSINDIAQKMGYEKLDAIIAARESVLQELATNLKGELANRLYELESSNCAKMDLKNRSMRNLKAVCLSYLTSIEDLKSQAYCLNLIEHSESMTNKVAGLNMLAHATGKVHDQAMKCFLDQWQDDALIMNKWFLAQALSKRPDAVDLITTLLDHPAYDIKNPNKVYSLIYAFAQNNIQHFHDVSGKGYRFLADHVIKINDFNPQVAARIMTPLCRWKQFDVSRQALMKTELERILAYENLSDAVRELAAKSL